MEDDRARFVELFQRHYGAVMRYAARRVGQDRASDVARTHPYHGSRPVRVSRDLAKALEPDEAKGLGGG